MKRPKLKKASKRVSCAKRYKIQKKVREHHRKVRREAKKSGIKRRPKKTLSVPNSAPFKEEVLREAEQRKLELEELKEQNKLQQQQKKRAEKRKKEREEKSAETEPSKKKAKKESKVKAQREARAVIAKEKSAKKFRCSELNKVIDASDVILEVLDARDPMGCRCPQLEEAVLKHDGKKRLMFVLNKIDLVPRAHLKKWTGYLQAQCPTFVFRSTTHLEDRTGLGKKQKVANVVLDPSRPKPCEALIQALEDLACKQGPDAVLKAGIVGFPNVGKSCIINTLKGARACPAGEQRGLTKSMQMVNISNNIRLIDSPAIVAAPSNSREKLAMRSLLADNKDITPVEAVRLLLKHCNQHQLMLQYNIPDYRNSLEFLTFFAKKRGFLQKGGQPDTEHAAAVFLKDWTGSKLKYCYKVPETNHLPPHLTEAMVTQMHEGVDLDRLRAANNQTISSVRNSTLVNIINSKGMTDGLLNADEIPEEKTATDDEEKAKEGNGTGKMMETEEVETPESKKAQTHKSADQKTRQQKRKGPAPAVNIDLLAAKQTDDDAYDFNRDFI